MRMTPEHAALLLGVGGNPSVEEVNHAWRVWAKLAHPDAGGDREHFEALAHARSVLLKSAPGAVKQFADHPSQQPTPRVPLRGVCCRPSGRGMLALMLLAFGPILLGLASPHMPEVIAAFAVGAAASGMAIAIQRTFLVPSADTGHRISVLVIAWLPIVVVLVLAVTYLGVQLIGLLPVVVLPFVTTVALVNPGAGLWWPTRQVS